MSNKSFKMKRDREPSRIPVQRILKLLTPEKNAQKNCQKSTEKKCSKILIHQGDVLQFQEFELLV